MDSGFGVKGKLWNWVGFRVTSLMLQLYLSSTGVKYFFIGVFICPRNS
jgi:hypothetical protein